MRTDARKERMLDALLAVLVITSLILWLRVWQEPYRGLESSGSGPSIKPQPAAHEGQMPDILRPEMILLHRDDNAVAPVHTDSLAYQQLWPRIREVLERLAPDRGAFLVDRVPDHLIQAEWIQLQLPIALTLGEWADRWHWNGAALRNESSHVDRLTFYLGEPGAIYLSGPTGLPLYLDDLTSDDRATLLQLMQRLDPSLFLPHRPLRRDLPGPRLEADLLVPALQQMPAAQLRAKPPDEQVEEARYFPDLSVVRQIDEQDARSFTDGQRLLRITDQGILEYRTATPSLPGPSPDLQNALTLSQEWVASRGGWHEALLLRRFRQEPGRTALEFDYRSGGPFPVESAGPAIQIHLAAHKVVYFSRIPTFVETRFHSEQQPIIEPETALGLAVEQIPGLLMEPIRSIHLAYMAYPSTADGAADWNLEPAWVIQAGESRIYVHAAVGREKLPAVLLR